MQKSPSVDFSISVSLLFGSFLVYSVVHLEFSLFLDQVSDKILYEITIMLFLFSLVPELLLFHCTHGINESLMYFCHL